MSDDMRKLMEAVMEASPAEEAIDDLIDSICKRVQEWIHMEVSEDDCRKVIWGLMHAYHGQEAQFARAMSRWAELETKARDYDDE